MVDEGAEFADGPGAGVLALFEAEGGEGGAFRLGVGLFAGEGVEDGGAAPGGEAEVGGSDAVGVAFAVLDEDAAGDGGVEDHPVAVVDAGASGGVLAQVRVEACEEAAERAFPVAGGEDDGVGGEPGAGALLEVFEVEFDFGGGDAVGGADGDSGGEDGVGPASVEGAAVELCVDGGDGAGCRCPCGVAIVRGRAGRVRVRGGSGSSGCSRG